MYNRLSSCHCTLHNGSSQVRTSHSHSKRLKDDIKYVGLGDIGGLYENTTLLSIRDWDFHGFGHPRGAPEDSDEQLMQVVGSLATDWRQHLYH